MVTNTPKVNTNYIIDGGAVLSNTPQNFQPNYGGTGLYQNSNQTYNNNQNTNFNNYGANVNQSNVDINGSNNNISVTGGNTTTQSDEFNKGQTQSYGFNPSNQYQQQGYSNSMNNPYEPKVVSSKNQNADFVEMTHSIN